MADLADIHDVIVDHPEFMNLFGQCLWNVDGADKIFWDTLLRKKSFN